MTTDSGSPVGRPATTAAAGPGTGVFMEHVSISCDECCLEGTVACDDCVVTFLFSTQESLCAGDQSATPEAETGAVLSVVGRARNGIVVDAAEVRAMKLLHGVGLVPSLRFERRVG
ncbi:MAG: hypothetical protein ACRD0B_09985 [Acidimicrobiales bacterium]